MLKGQTKTMSKEIKNLTQDTMSPIKKINWTHNAEGTIVASSKQGYIWLTQVNGQVVFRFQPQWKSRPFTSLERAKAYAEFWVPDES